LAARFIFSRFLPLLEGLVRGELIPKAGEVLLETLVHGWIVIIDVFRHVILGGAQLDEPIAAPLLVVGDCH
jgi:hypothetical protein